MFVSSNVFSQFWETNTLRQFKKNYHYIIISQSLIFCSIFRSLNSPLISNQQHTVFYKLMCWLAGSLTCRLPNVVRSPPARRSRKLSHYWLMFGSSLTMFYNTQRRTTCGRTPLDEWSVRRRDLYRTTQNTHNRQTSMSPVGFEPTIPAGERP